MTAVPQGFEVSPDQVTAAGRTVCELAEDLRSARSTWDGAGRDGGKTCGMDVVAKAYTTMQDAWFDEIGVHITILEQACEALRASAEGYRGTDQRGAARHGGGGGARVE